ncbi:hypothetical protein SSIG_06607 [Streptomyces filamentosus NRRL 11379]|uniref:Predicted protein n=1 Tax=Streptomyces filamentosus NRRL 15998 TaxID=457431 RepID=D6AFJ0_STRFL|nr:predicted protein [Streptomyces filamentosus NRRL 15998]EWS95840.1 hypothetical protein SSIG_06607 [Streptomyces filamentosus NRRL 11379]
MQCCDAADLIREGAFRKRFLVRCRHANDCSRARSRGRPEVSGPCHHRTPGGRVE